MLNRWTTRSSTTLASRGRFREMCAPDVSTGQEHDRRVETIRGESPAARNPGASSFATGALSLILRAWHDFPEYQDREGSACARPFFRAASVTPGDRPDTE